MSSFVEFAQRTEIVARFKRVLLLFWLPLVLAAAVPAVMIVVAAWFESPNSIQLLPPSPKEPPLPELEVVPPAPTPVLGDGTPAVAQMTLDGTLAVAQQFPGGKLVEMTVMFGAGSAADVTARHLADGMSKSLGVPVPVVNRTGGGGAIGYSHVQQQKPDGYSIIWNSNSVSTNYHSGIMSFDYQAFDAVPRVSVETPAIAVRSDAPWKTLKELIDYAKANPGKVRIGNSGTGSHTHFVSSALFADAKITNVPFGEGQAVVNLLGSRIEGVVQLPAALVAHVKSGDLRVLAMLGEKRDAIFADVP